MARKNINCDNKDIIKNSTTSKPLTSMRKLGSTALLSPARRSMATARLKQALDVYVSHRPTVQRVLTAGFVLYCLTTTYRNLSGKGAKGGAREKTSRRGAKSAGSAGESLAPALSVLSPQPPLTTMMHRWEEEGFSIGPALLCPAQEARADRHSLVAIARGSDVGTALGIFGSEDRTVALCCRP